MTTRNFVTYVCPSCKTKTLETEGGFVPTITFSVPKCKDCNSDMERIEYSAVKSLWNKVVRK